MRIVRFLLSVATVSVIVWWVWSMTDLSTDMAPSADPLAIQFKTLGVDAQRGNLLAVQPWLRPQDYASAATLERKLATYLQAAQDQGGLQGDKTIAVFPEYIGTWLVAEGEKNSALQAPDIGSAMTTVALTHLPAFIYRLATAPSVAAPDKWALFTVKAPNMAASYESVFGSLAKRFGVQVVAGSIVLPQPELVNGRLRVHPGAPLVSMSALFGPDGRIVPPLILKAYPIDEEQTFTVAGHAQLPPVFDTPAGKLAVLICADAWYPQRYQEAQQAGATLMAVPSYSTGNGVWALPWGGYNGSPNPADIDTADIGKLTEGQAWQKYAMVGRAPGAGIPTAVNVFLRGQLWDLGSDGATLALQSGQTVAQDIVPTAALTNLWIP